MSIIFVILFICIVCVLGVVIWGIIDNHMIDKIYKDYTVIAEAIFLYRMNCIDNGAVPLVNYDDMTPIKTVIDRWSYKGYKSILDSKKLFILRNYIPIVLSHIKEPSSNDRKPSRKKMSKRDEMNQYRSFNLETDKQMLDLFKKGE